MIIVFGLVVLLTAVIVGLAGVLSNSGTTHALTEAEGRADHAKGNLEQSGAKIKDAFKR